MSGVFSYRMVLALIIGAILMWHIYDDENSVFSAETNIYAYGCLLLVYMASLSLVLLLIDEWESAWNQILTMWFDTFLSISLYYCAVVLLIKPLRKILKARTCALLWLVPNYLHFLQRSNVNMEQEKPLLILAIPQNIVSVLFVLWLLGCLGILGYHTVTHLSYRKMLLRDSNPAMSQEIAALWEEEKQNLCLQDKNIPLIFSPNTSTPLSIGLLEKSIRVVLPIKDYTPEELRLIFRHELTHISRKDSFTKLFLVLCNSLCWFNPLMWIAVKRSAEDIELSCDERVIVKEPASVRKQYASLILSTAGDQRGFTTCLSATARAMTYRLRNILYPRKKIRGGWIAALVFVILASTSGQVALAYGQESGAHVIYRDTDPTEHQIRTISLPSENHFSTLSCRDTEALGEFLSGLTLNRITGNYELPEYERTLYLYLFNGESGQVVTIKDQFLSITPILQRGHNVSFYQITTPVDWYYLESLVEYGPSLRLSFLTEDSIKYTNATMYNLDRIQEGVSTPVKRGSETTDISSLLDETTNSIMLAFSHELAEPYTVTIENWDRTQKTVLRQDQLEKTNTIPRLHPHAHYSVKAKQDAGDGSYYDVEFRFDCFDFVTVDN